MDALPQTGRHPVQIAGRELKLSNLGKVLYPRSGTTKADALRFYEAVAEVLLPHLHDRPVTFNRFPDGITGSHFYEKRKPPHAPDWVRTAEVPSDRKGRPIEYVLIDDLATLLWSVNLANLEMHPMLYRAPALDRPTMLMFDLDPGAPADVVDCARVAVLLEGLFGQLDLVSFVKTSGSKGLQLAVPLNDPDVTFADTKPFAAAVARTLERARPDLVVAKQAKDLRTGKVLVDWSQNDDHKTTVCVHSLRARTDPPHVSTPLTWEETRAVADGDLTRADVEFTPTEALARLEEHGDLWAPVQSVRQSLPSLAG